MASKHEYDAVIVGSGPNGLAAAITLARHKLRVLVLEGKNTIGGGSRSAQLTLPGFIHDVCSAVHPLAVSSFFFRSLPLEQYGLKFIFPPVSLAHPLDGGRAVLVRPSLSETAKEMGKDAESYYRTYAYLLANWDRLSSDLLSPLRIPRYPFLLVRFGIYALQSAIGFANRRFRREETKAVFAGMAGHSMLSLDSFASASFGLVLSLSAHAVGWPVVAGGSQRIVDALAGYLQELGGEIQTGWMVRHLDDLPKARAVLLDISPRQFLEIAGDKMPSFYRNQLARYRYGPGVFKVDWALDAPIPWQNPSVRDSATVHLGGTLEEIAESERQVWQGQVPEKPYVLLVQPSLFDPGRATQGKHTAWAYCHVPSASSYGMRMQIEEQVERFAPGFRKCILAYHTMTAVDYERYNPNYIGGDINAGVQDIWQFFTRPVIRWNSYSTPLKGVYLCSSATPPGGGVHGMCGYLAAKSALKREFLIN